MEALAKVEKSRVGDNWTYGTQILEQLFEMNTDNKRIAVELAENYIHSNLWTPLNLDQS